jgi:two-component system sensor histidine kinase RegB
MRLGPPNTEPVDALRLLFWLRIVAICSQALVIALIHFGFGIRLPLMPLALTLAALASWALVTVPGLRAEREVTAAEVAVHFAVDIAAFTSVLYFTGGPANPFVSLYLLPISLAAISLPALYAWLVGGLCGLGYTLLWWWHVPLPSVQGRFGGDFDLHMAGMWVNFIIAASLIVFFVERMARTVRQRDQELAAMREASLRDQQIVELGALAAGTAHEINTPLSTLAMLIEELEDTAGNEAQRSQLQLMMEQIELVNDRLNRIVGGVGAQRSAGARAMTMKAFITEVIDDWRQLHDDIELDVKLALPEPGPRIAVEATLVQAMRSVLDNAADASRYNSQSRVGISVSYEDSILAIEITDHGRGLDPLVRDEIGLKILSTKGHGLGMGLLLSRAALQRIGGGLDLRDHACGGVAARIRIPVDTLLADA